ncbi:MAG: nucleoside triphosphate pyrophosphohydrolase [Acidimicrobiia bacterium]
MSITVVGLGPSHLDMLDPTTRGILDSPNATLIVRTERHPASEEIAAHRSVVFCDDLYREASDFDTVYRAIVDRVVAEAARGDVVYAVPGSPSVGERAVPVIVDEARSAGIDVRVVPAPSFLDLAYVEAGIDPIADGVQILDARELPDPLPFHVPTIITQVDSLLRATDTSVTLAKTLPDDTNLVLLDRLGDMDQVSRTITLSELATYEAGARTSVVVPAVGAGLYGLIATNRILRSACPWDMKQTHHSLLTHLIEEAYETADAIGHLPMNAPGGEPDYGAYAEVEDELGDLLLQVVFHATLAAEAGAFDIDEVAELNRRKLIRRHPHVFADVEVGGADDVLANWEEIKQEEKQRESMMDDIPGGMPAVAKAMKVQKRAASVGFDWDTAEPVFEVLRSEIAELEAAHGDDQATRDELGDLLFAAINLARHLSVDPEVALRGSVDRFQTRFRHVERALTSDESSMRTATIEQLNAAWKDAKRATS